MLAIILLILTHIPTVDACNVYEVEPIPPSVSVEWKYFVGPENNWTVSTVWSVFIRGGSHILFVHAYLDTNERWIPDGPYQGGWHFPGRY